VSSILIFPARFKGKNASRYGIFLLIFLSKSTRRMTPVVSQCRLQYGQIS
jgi:hypothetical protein